MSLCASRVGVSDIWNKLHITGRSSGTIVSRIPSTFSSHCFVKLHFCTKSPPVYVTVDLFSLFAKVSDDLNACFFIICLIHVCVIHSCMTTMTLTCLVWFSTHRCSRILPCAEPSHTGQPLQRVGTQALKQYI